MAIIDMKQEFRGDIAPYLTKIKSEIQKIGAVTGQLAGSSATLAGMPTTDADGTALEAGDWAILSADDGANESGIYVYDGATWAFAVDLVAWNEIIDGLIATDAEATAGTATDKVATVKQNKDMFSLLAGDATQTHAVAMPDAASSDAVPASAFVVDITQAEADADWDAA